MSMICLFRSAGLLGSRSHSSADSSEFGLWGDAWTSAIASASRPARVRRVASAMRPLKSKVMMVVSVSERVYAKDQRVLLPGLGKAVADPERRKRSGARYREVRAIECGPAELP